jgi:predicted heme/steroid binding protein
MIKQLLTVIGTAIVFNLLLNYYLGSRNTIKTSSKTFTLEWLEKQGTKDNKNLYLAVLGKIYDVSKGAKHYEPGGSYDFFVGKDASRAYVTGDFVNDLNDNINDLDDSKIADLFKWQDFYEKDYTFVGFLEGKFYDKNGKKTQYLVDTEKKRDNQKKVIIDTFFT